MTRVSIWTCVNLTTPISPNHSLKITLR